MYLRRILRLLFLPVVLATEEIQGNFTAIEYVPDRPVKLSMKQGLLMNQVLAVYALDNAEGELCKKHSNEFKTALRAFEPWALQMFDSSSKLQAGVLMGNLMDFGSYHQCLNIHKHTPSGLITGKHCVLKIKPSIELIYKILTYRSVSERRFKKIFVMVERSEIGWSVCVPDSCSGKDILQHFNRTIRETMEGLEIGVSLDENYCSNLSERPEMGAMQYAVIAFFASFIVLGLIAAVVDYNSSEQNIIVHIFSAYTNLQKVMAKGRTSKENLGFLHGLKLLSSCYVVMGHRYIMYIMLPVVNQLHILDWILQYSSTLILGSTVSVDSFFMTSGMLVSIGFFDYVTKTGHFNLALFYVHRYLRITTPLALVVLFYCTLAQFLGNGPLLYDVYLAHQKPCQDYWWSTLLHVQDYVNPGKLCIYPIWYLSCEMPFYFLSPIVLYPLWKWPVFGYVNLVLIYAVSMAVSFYLAWVNKYEGEMLPITNQLFDTKYFQKYYIVPHTRAAPYIMGLVFGYIIFKTRGRKIIISKPLNITTWIISLSVMASAVFGCHNFQLESHDYNRLESSAYLAFSRSAWTMGLIWIMWSCLNGYGGVINDFLSAQMFRVLGRVTYGIFLLHTILQLYKSGSTKIPIYFSNLHVIYDSIADISLVFMLAFLFTIFYELPLVRAEELLFKPTETKKIKPKQQE